MTVTVGGKEKPVKVPFEITEKDTNLRVRITPLGKGKGAFVQFWTGDRFYTEPGTRIKPGMLDMKTREGEVVVFG